MRIIELKELVPKLDILKHKLEQKTDKLNKERQTHFLLEQLPYSLTCISIIISDFINIARLTISDAINRSLKDKNSLQVISLNNQEKLSLLIDMFLDKARCAQNAISLYLSKALSISFPKSMNDIFKSINSGKLTIPNEIKISIIEYWKNHGKLLKDYRDLSQHTAIVSSDSRIIIQPSGDLLLYFV